MGIINILDEQTANMIAAGEVCDRPASAVKELIENSVDAGATVINIEIKGGGKEYIRVTDNGNGFSSDDMPKALLRHATSKILTGNDLVGIKTLGFRGEALAAISSVSRIEIISKRRQDELGTRLTGDENGIVMDDTGCPDGTTVIIKDLFYNLPARYKFLKRDSTEAAACAAVAERIALSHPEISFTFIKEGERKFFTPGDGKLLSAIYSIFGRDFANGIKKIDYELEGVKVYGYVTTPENNHGTRNMQIFFINGRYVRSKTVMAALEEAFKSYMPTRKYPAGIINIILDEINTDVNVHPAKLEIKFSDERKIFRAVYYAVKNMLETPDKILENELPVKNRQPNGYSPADNLPIPPRKKDGSVIGYEVFKPDIGESDLPVIDLNTDKNLRLKSRLDPLNQEEIKDPEKSDTEQKEQITFVDEKKYSIIGEAYNAFIFVELTDRILIIDKHAAHERVIYEQLSDKKEVSVQQLLEGITVTLQTEQAEALSLNLEYLEEYGFIAEPFGDSTLIIRAVPSVIGDYADLKGLFEDFAAKLMEGNTLSFAERCDRALFTVACKAAMKAGEKNNPAHNEWLVERLLSGGDIKYCPHGRPVLKTITKRELEKFFDR